MLLCGHAADRAERARAIARADARQRGRRRALSLCDELHSRDLHQFGVRNSEGRAAGEIRIIISAQCVKKEDGQCSARVYAYLRARNSDEASAAPPPALTTSRTLGSSVRACQKPQAHLPKVPELTVQPAFLSPPGSTFCPSSSNHVRSQDLPQDGCALLDFWARRGLLTMLRSRLEHW